MTLKKYFTDEERKKANQKNTKKWLDKHPDRKKEYIKNANRQIHFNKLKKAIDKMLENGKDVIL